MSYTKPQKKVAIIGYSFRLPGCQERPVSEALLSGDDLVTEVDPSRWTKSAYQHPDKKFPGTSYTFAAGTLGDISGFDAAFFGLSPREVMHMDPQQRIVLEMTWEAIEHAGYAPSSQRGSDCAVYMGVASVDYGLRYHDDLNAMDQNTGTGSTSSIVANRISYLFDFKGPSLSLDTACSSSMVALHHACESIRRGESTTAIAGGVSLHCYPFGFIAFGKASMLSRQGRCRVFDASADGYVRSEGGGVVFLKDYDAAMADGDNVIAVIAATTANTDGHKSALTIPNPEAQIDLMRQAAALAGISPDDFTYMEAHGTGTPVGDPIEAKAIGEGIAQLRKQPLLVGSVKSNMGHLETASGMAGLAKALICIEERIIPATIGIEELNPNIPFNKLNLSVVTENHALPKDQRITIGVNSFGFGGANAHAILQSPVAPQSIARVKPAAEPQAVALRLSARDENGLRARAQQLSSWLQLNPSQLYNMAWTLHYHREQHPRGLWVTGTDTKAVVEQLTAYAADPASQALNVTQYIGAQRKPVFVYTGNGCQWAGMAKALMQTSERFRTCIEEVDRHFIELADFSLAEMLLGTGNVEVYQHTELAQPALFALQVGVTTLLRDAGVEPAAVVGHSVGEVAAAWACGALTLEQAVQVIFHRSAGQGQTAGTGMMTAVAVSAEQMNTWLEEWSVQGVCLAGINSANGVTVAGEVTALATLEAQLIQLGVRFKRLDLNYAFHSPAMEPIEASLRTSLAHIKPAAANVPYYSTVTGSEFDTAGLTAEYWWKNIREPVAFHAALHQLTETHHVLIEIGAHPILSGYIKDTLKQHDISSHLIIPTVSKEGASVEHIESTVAKVWASGSDLDWARWFPDIGQRVHLPAYPWQRESFWLPVTPESYGFLMAEKVHPLLGSAVPKWKNAWENILDTQLYPWLAEHQVGDGTPFPGAGFVELVLAAAAQAGYLSAEQQVVEIEELEIRSPLMLAKSPAKKVRTILRPQHGHLTIESREYNSNDNWDEHAKARLLPETAGLMLQKKAPKKPRRKADFIRDDIHRAAEQAELYYGDTFQCISKGWVEQQTVIGEIEPLGDALVAHEHYQIHPGVLDSVFQLVIALLYKNNTSNVVFVPIQVGRLQWKPSTLPCALAEVTLKSRLPHSLLMDVSVFDSKGKAVLVMQDLRLRASIVRKRKEDKLDFLQAYVLPAPLLHHRRIPVNLAAQEQAIQKVLEHSANYQEYLLEVEPLLDTLSELILHEAFKQQDIKPSATMLLQQLVEHVGWEAPDEIEAELHEVWFALLHDYPAHFYLTQRLGQFFQQLQRFITGQNGLAELTLSPVALQQTYTQALRAMLSETAQQNIARTLQQGLQALSSQLAPGQRLSVLELSGGEPWWVPRVIDGLDTTVVDYYCVLSSEASEDTAVAMRQTNPELKWLAKDSWCELKKNTLWVDVAYITLDFTNLDEAHDLLMPLANVLQPEGELMVFMHHPTRWLDYALGLQKAWWRGERQTQQVEWVQWEMLFRSLGFTVIEDAYHDQVLLSGTHCVRLRPQNVMPKALPIDLSKDNALTLVMGGALPDTAIAELQRHGGAVRNDVSLNDIPTLLSATHEQPVNIVMLPDAAAPESGVQRCTALQRLLLLLQTVRLPDILRIVLVTQNAGVRFIDNHNSSVTETWVNTPVDAIDDAALWGFARTVMNELPQFPLYLVDLPKVQDFSSALVDEIVAHSNETEVVYQQNGGRMVVRLCTEVPDKQPEDTAKKPVSLGFVMPGQLRNLTWMPIDMPELGDDEVKIDVKATGLNFRDVMYALGLLSDEAVENGYSGPSIGLEFTGVVTAVGAQVTDYEPGDGVVGFGPSSFSTELIAKTAAIAHIPAGLSFEAAATIPTTFFTAWYALKHVAQLQAGERILIHGAAGGVGIAAIQIAQSMGAEIFATAGSGEKRDFLTMLGVQHIFDSRSNLFAEEILATTPDGQGVDVVLNSLAGEAIAQNLRVLKPFGRFLELGKRDFYENTPMGLRPFRNNISYFGIDSDQLMKVKPYLTEQVFQEVMALFQRGDLFPLPYTTFAADRVEEAFRFMQQAKQIGKIVVNYPERPQVPCSQCDEFGQLKLKSNGSYLVTGGLSGFGLATANWLVKKGAKTLGLISKSGKINAEAQAYIAEWQAAGVTVLPAACDVTHRAALADYLAQLNAKARLVGVVHAATVYDDGLLTQLTEAQIERVMNVKMLGAKHLHELTKNLELFVLYSSATTVFGNPGQSHYVGANHWFEAFAAWRRANGLAALAVNWGAIDDVGYLSRETQVKESLNSRLGADAFTSTQALNALEQLILNKRTGVSVLKLDWGTLSRVIPSAQQPKFSVLNASVKSGVQQGDQRGAILSLLEQGNMEEAEARMIELLTRELSNILLLPEAKIDPNQTIYDLGFDSLMALELMTSVDQQLNIQLPAMALNDKLTLARLAALLIDKMHNPDVESHGEKAEIEEMRTALASIHGLENEK